MALTESQKTTLKAYILAQPDLAPLTSGPTTDYSALASALNGPGAPAFVVWRSVVNTSEVGVSVNYVAVEAMTDANRTRITTFYAMNPVSFKPRSDIRSYWANTFSGALGGQGQATRDALEALWRRNATRAEQAFATGTGTTNTPGDLGSFEGSVSVNDINEMFTA